MLDVVVVGSGPNGLAAAVVLARAGLQVHVLESQPTLGGGARTLDLGLGPGLVHDICSAVHPMAVASEFFAEFDLQARGVGLVQPELAYAQPLDGGRAALAWRDIERTAEGLGRDGDAWRSLLGPLAEHQHGVLELAMADHRHVPGDLLTALRFTLRVLEQGTPAWGLRFHEDAAPALITGAAMHAIDRMPSLGSSGGGLMLAAMAHGTGWPLPVGGSGAIVRAMVDDVTAHGGTFETDHPVRRMSDLPAARSYLLNTTPTAAVRILGDAIPARRRRALSRFTYGNGAAKVDYVLSGPVPWASEHVREAGTVHLGGTREQVAAAEAEIDRGRHAELPNVLASDPALHDPSREVGGLRPFWTYAHVPAGSDVDVTEQVTAQVERFAPGFRDLVVTSACIPAARMTDHNENYVGGDIAAGAMTVRQVFARPTAAPDPYLLARGNGRSAYLCSASAPPGPGVHGLCGLNAAASLLRREHGRRELPPLAP